MKIGQILLCCMSSIYNMFFWLSAEDWELFPDPFLILLKWQQSEIWLFLIAVIYHFQLSHIQISKNETLESWHNCLLSNWSILEQLSPSPPNCSKDFWKLLTLFIICQLAKFDSLMSCASEDIFKNTPCLMY